MNSGSCNVSIFYVMEKAINNKSQGDNYLVKYKKASDRQGLKCISHKSVKMYIKSKPLPTKK